MGIELTLGREVVKTRHGLESGSLDNGYLVLNGLVADSEQRWHLRKIERNALTAMMISWSFLRSWTNIQKRGPYGLVQGSLFDKEGGVMPVIYSGSLFPDSAFASQPDLELAIVEASSLIESTNKFDLRAEVRSIQQLDAHQLKSKTYKRLLFMTNPYWRHGKVVHSKQNGVIEFIGGGIDTAQSSLAAISLVGLENFIRAHNGCLPTREQLALIVEGGKPGLSFLAAHNVDQSAQLLKFVNTGKPREKMFNPDLFDLIQQRNRFKTNMRKVAIEQLQEYLKPSPVVSVTTGCPALVPLSSLLAPDELVDLNLPFNNIIEGYSKWLAEIIRS